MKPRFKYMLAENPEVQNQDGLKDVLWQTIRSFDPVLIQRIQTANMRYVRSMVPAE